ncbi:hypothetical protein EDB19DRAFT_1838663 [Suillus lakei]|nr:hypothetical protein EDB19DRAFT_1838663 [Suillus lakei]
MASPTTQSVHRRATSASANGVEQRTHDTNAGELERRGKKDWQQEGRDLHPKATSPTSQRTPAMTFVPAPSSPRQTLPTLAPPTPMPPSPRVPPSAPSVRPQNALARANGTETRTRGTEEYTDDAEQEEEIREEVLRKENEKLRKENEELRKVKEENEKENKERTPTAQHHPHNDDQTTPARASATTPVPPAPSIQCQHLSTPSIQSNDTPANANDEGMRTRSNEEQLD